MPKDNGVKGNGANLISNIGPGDTENRSRDILGRV